MKMKKVLALVMAGLMTASLAACGSSDSESTDSTTDDASSEADASSDAEDGADVDTEAPADLEGHLTIWTLAKDLESFAAHFMEAYPNVEIETVVIAPADYVTKAETAILGGDDSVDIIVGEPQMLPTMFEEGLFLDLDENFNAQQYADKIVDYVWEVGQLDGTQYAISYQITPAGIYYRRDIAEKVFGYSDPESVGKLFADYPTIVETARTLKAAGYRAFASDSEVNYFSGDSAWVIDEKLNIDPAREAYMDLVVQLYQEDLTAYAAQWAAPWYQAMSGPVPILTAELQWGDWGTSEDGTVNLNVWDAENFAANAGNYTDESAEVFAFGLPAWGVLTLRDNVKETSGNWGVCAGPAYGFGGGTFIGISSLSQNAELAWEFVKFVTLNDDTADWWIEFSEGDTVSLLSALERHADDENPVYGNQKLYSFWLEQAQGIDYSKVTQYDTAIGDAWGTAISSVKTGEKDKATAIEEFKNSVKATYPNITVE